MGRANSNRAWILGVGSWVLNCTSGEVRLSGVGESGGVAGVTRRVRVVPPAWDGCPCGGPGMCHGRLWERGLCECEGVGGCGRSDSVVVCAAGGGAVCDTAAVTGFGCVTSRLGVCVVSYV